ncbi:Zinc finger CCCH domain-containing protein 7, partial [Habropoda laboriosa]
KLPYMEKPITNQNLNLAKSEKHINLLHKSEQFSRTPDSTLHNELTSTNVYINPNFRPQNSAIHINPKLHVKSLVHINPKMMKNVINSNENVQTNSVNTASITSNKQNSVQNQNPIQKSVHVNPKLMKKLSSSVQFKPIEHKEIKIQNITHPVRSILKLVKSTNSPKIIHGQRKINNSNIVILSQRKLILELCKIKKSTNSIAKNIKPIPQKITKTKIINALNQSINKDINFTKSSVMKHKINKYRIDRTAPKAASVREHADLNHKKTIQTNVLLILISFFIYSNKVKQRSIQILRNKMQKNNQPCLIFQKFGYCSNHEKGICVKRHDKKQISLCRKFLQGNCMLDNCPLSHDIGPEKMPTCKYFLEGCCTKDACPYRHIKVSSNTPICIEFLQGYCTKGSECKQRHENLCPEFEKTKKCSKGKHCPYPHKSQSSSNKQNHLKRKYNIPKNQMTPPVTKDTSISNTENRLRYYEQASTLNKALDKRRENIIKKVQLMKRVEFVTYSNTTEISDSNTNLEVSGDNDKSEIISDPKKLKRPPIGILPAYIPID